MQYTVKLYKDLVAGTPDAATATLVATYGPTLSAVPLTSTQLNSSLFVSAESATPAIAALAAGTTVGSTVISWTAPTAPDLFAQSVNIFVGNSNSSGTTSSANVDGNVAGTATTATLAVPLVTAANFAGATIEYMDSSFRRYWTSF
jgi:hypothetical protein